MERYGCVFLSCSCGTAPLLTCWACLGVYSWTILLQLFPFSCLGIFYVDTERETPDKDGRPSSGTRERNERSVNSLTSYGVRFSASPLLGRPSIGTGGHVICTA